MAKYCLLGDKYVTLQVVSKFQDLEFNPDSFFEEP